MRVSIERLRFWIVALAGLLVVSILLFFAYARWQARRIVHDLPGKLGISIQQSTNGFTLSKSQGGHTLFTLHASKVVQYTGGGRAELHDVRITLYNADGAPADAIYGNDFNYDPAGVIRAKGEVQIDLQGPENSKSPSPAGSTPGGEKENLVHVKTSNLIFNQKTGQASTTEEIEFRTARAAGSATGAIFDSRAGDTVLERDIAFNSSMDGYPLVVHARHAHYDRFRQELHLFQDSVEYRDNHGFSDQALVHLRRDGSAERVDAQGNVKINGQDRMVLCQKLRADIDQANKPVRTVLEGGVFYSADNLVRTLHGTASSAILFFGLESNLRHAQLRDGVSVVEEEKAVQKQSHSVQPVSAQPTRKLEASQVDVDFSPHAGNRSVAQRILAVGKAQLTEHALPAGQAPQEISVAGDRLLAILRNGMTISSLNGTGNIHLKQISSNGVEQTSSSDRLWMTFVSPPSNPVSVKGMAAKPSVANSAQVSTSDQQGNVVLVQRGAAGAKSPAEFTARAQRAVYNAATQKMKLSGDPEVRDTSGRVSANFIELERLTGNGTATGNVRAVYRQSNEQPHAGSVVFGGPGPAHIVAAMAHFDRSKDQSIFYGSASEKARLWQGSETISAPVLELSRLRQTLFAHGAVPSQTGAVNAVLVDSGARAGAKKSPQGVPKTSVVLVRSQTLLYSSAGDKALFRGGVFAQEPDGSIRSDTMVIHLESASKTNSGAPASSAGAGEVERVGQKQVESIVAQGSVQLKQPGREATGQELVYTAADERFVLTGSRSAPPRLIDAVHGTITGDSLIFNDRDDSVVVNGGQSKAVTETRTAK